MAEAGEENCVRSLGSVVFSALEFIINKFQELDMSSRKLIVINCIYLYACVYIYYCRNRLERMSLHIWYVDII